MKKFDGIELSVLIPSWNSQDYIERALESIYSQEGVSFEVIIVDNNSTDDTHKIVNEKNLPNLYLDAAKDKGMYDALNRGITRAKGKVISWLGADDQVAPGAFAKAMNVFYSQESVQWLAGEAEFVFEGVRGSGETKNHVLPDRITSAMLIKGNMLVSPSVYFKRDFFLSQGAFDVSYKLAGDYDLWVRFVLAQEPYVLHEVLSKFSYNGANASSNQKIAMYRETLRALEQVKRPSLQFARAINIARLNLYILWNRMAK